MKTRSLIAACTVGNFLGWYDYALYGYLTPILARLFFPTAEEYDALFNTLLIFAIGFIMRPLGSIIFGMIGDRAGRKMALLISVLFMTIPTMLMGMLPTYAQIGVVSIVALTIMRVVQGIPVGGEIGGVLCYLIEIAPHQKRGFFGSWTFFGAQFGFIISSLEIHFIEKWMPFSTFSNWGWRISFIAGGLIGILGWYLRLHLHESPKFEYVVNHHQILKNPVTTTFKNYKKELLQAFCLSSIAAGGFYTTYFFTTIFLKKMLPYHVVHTLLVDAATLTLSCICLPLFGKLGDRYGIKRLVKISLSGIMVLPFFMFYYASEGKFAVSIACQVLLTLFLTLNYALTPALLARLFPTHIRYSGVGIAYNLANAILGGPAPLIALYLIKVTGSNIAPAFYFIFMGLLSLIPLLMKDRTLEQTT